MHYRGGRCQVTRRFNIFIMLDECKQRSQPRFFLPTNRVWVPERLVVNPEPARNSREWVWEAGLVPRVTSAEMELSQLGSLSPPQPLPEEGLIPAPKALGSAWGGFPAFGASVGPGDRDPAGFGPCGTEREVPVGLESCWELGLPLGTSPRCPLDSSEAGKFWVLGKAWGKEFCSGG